MRTKLLLKEKKPPKAMKKPRKISLHSRGLKCLRNRKIHKMLEKLFQHLNIEKYYKASFEHNCHEMEKSRTWSGLELEPSGSTQKLCCHFKTPLKQNLSWTPHVLQRQVASPAGLVRAGCKAGAALQEACPPSAQCTYSQ